MAKQFAVRNIGIMTNKQINGLVKQFEAIKGVKVSRGDLVHTVHTDDGQLVLSAARLNRQNWHVRAIPEAITVA